MTARRVILAASLMLVPLSAPAQEAAPVAPVAPPVNPMPAPAPKMEPKIDAEAVKLVRQMVAAHQALQSFGATVSGIGVEGDKTQLMTGTIRYAKPNKVAVTVKVGDAKEARTAVSDGKYLYFSPGAVPGTYERITAESDAKTITQVLATSGSSVTGLLPVIFGNPKAADLIIPKNADVVEFAPDETVEGTEARVVRFAMSSPAKAAFTLAIGKTDNLLRRVSIQLEGGPRKLSITETYTGVQVNPPATAEMFKFTPPAGTKLNEAPKTTETALPFDPRLKVGAAPLPFSGTDTSGSPVALAGYKGKVVLVDFWATWCPPCREEIPIVVAAYKKYHAKGFEVVGVSLDAPTDAAKLASYTKANAMPWRQVHDKQSAISNAYGVKFIPFALLIGRDGKIAALNMRGPELEKAVAAALKK